MKSNKRGEAIYTIIITIIVIAIITLIFVGIPNYRVYIAGKSGEALLKKANQEKQIMVTQAQAEVEAAQLRAEAIGIVGKASKDYPEYRLQEFIGAFGDAMNNGAIEKIIYVPTEANIPILEVKQ